MCPGAGSPRSPTVRHRTRVHVQAPGSGLLYSGGGYTVLQLAVEEITGQPFAAYMRANVLTPLGMSSSAFEWLPDLRSRTATAYRPEFGLIGIAAVALLALAVAAGFPSLIPWPLVLLAGAYAWKLGGGSVDQWAPVYGGALPLCMAPKPHLPIRPVA